MVLRPAPIAGRQVIDIQLYPSNDGATVYLRPASYRRFPDIASAPPPSGFPYTQYEGLRVRNGAGVTIDLCLVDEVNGATGMGGIPKLRRSADVKAIYLVETTDADASPVRIRTTTGIKSIRRKT